MKADYHLHTSFSTDSDARPEAMLEKAIQLGLENICITDHMDLDFPKEKYHMDFIYDLDEYFLLFKRLKKEYENKINLHIGIELGLQPHIKDEYTRMLSDYPFDFVIGSTHLVDKYDIYYDEYYQDKGLIEGYKHYFDTVLLNIKNFSDVDVIGHIDYIFRYGPNSEDYNFKYADFGDVLDEILKTCIAKGIGIELNTAGFKYGLGHPNPHENIIKRYKELGGEIITIGSDGHKPEHMAYSFSLVNDILSECGFYHYNIFRERKPVFIDL